MAYLGIPGQNYLTAKDLQMYAPLLDRIRPSQRNDSSSIFLDEVNLALTNLLA